MELTALDFSEYARAPCCCGCLNPDVALLVAGPRCRPNIGFHRGPTYDIPITIKCSCVTEDTDRTRLRRRCCGGSTVRLGPSRMAGQEGFVLLSNPEAGVKARYVYVTAVVSRCRTGLSAAVLLLCERN
jgi:hypothetical protein